MKNRPVVFSPLLAVLCVLFLVSFSACGRRGDPIPLSPHDGEVIKITPPKKLIEPDDILDCGNAGTGMRLYAGLLSGIEEHGPP